jgi:hypothetical protein
MVVIYTFGVVVISLLSGSVHVVQVLSFFEQDLVFLTSSPQLLPNGLR